jgi:hypothetical protein
MTRPPISRPCEPGGNRKPRSQTTLIALTFGVPLAIGLLYLVHADVIGNEDVKRYVKHDVEMVEVVFFCCALGAFAAKLWSYGTERAVLRQTLLPAWDGRAVGVSEAGSLLDGLTRVRRGLQNTYLVRRVAAILDFVRSRKSAADLDDQLRTLADNDAMALENSYALTRFITWAIPILGFLGTVLGITQSISGVTPEKLEHNLSEVTDGLALAFDATALALGLTMVTMFLSFLLDRAEQGVLLAVDRYADEQLAHRFERPAGEGGEVVEIVRQNTNVLVQATEQLVQKQADVWAKAFAETQRQRAEVEQRQQKMLLGALETMLERTLETHAKRLANLEKALVEQSKDLLGRMAAFAEGLRESGREQQETLTRLVENVNAQAEALAHLQAGETQLVKVQEVLAQNLNVLAGAGAFEEAVHSLTSAIHLLTARTVALPSGGTSRLGQRPGAAA